jgi:hypothetical protein
VPQTLQVCDVLGVCGDQLEAASMGMPALELHSSVTKEKQDVAAAAAAAAASGDVPLSEVAAAMKRKRAREAGLLPGATLKPRVGAASTTVVPLSGPFGDTCDVCKVRRRAVC